MYICKLVIEFDMELLGKKLKEQKEKREKSKKAKRQEYTPVELDSGMDNKETFENDPLLPFVAKDVPLKPKLTKDKPLPAPPTKKKVANATLETHSNKTTPSQSKPSKKRSHAPPPPPQKQVASPIGIAGEIARIHEAARRKQSEGAQPFSGTTTQHSAHIKHMDSPNSSMAHSFDEVQELEGIMEPLYANTASTTSSTHSLSQPNETSYQNVDFSGPPLSQPDISTATTVTDSSSNDQIHYQNFAFQMQKGKKQKPQKAKKSANVLSHSDLRSKKEQPQQCNSSTNENEGNLYQNVGFKVQRS